MHDTYQVGSNVMANVKVVLKQTNKQTSKQTGQKQYAPGMYMYLGGIKTLSWHAKS